MQCDFIKIHDLKAAFFYLIHYQHTVVQRYDFAVIYNTLICSVFYSLYYFSEKKEIGIMSSNFRPASVIEGRSNVT